MRVDREANLALTEAGRHSRHGRALDTQRFARRVDLKYDLACVSTAAAAGPPLSGGQRHGLAIRVPSTHLGRGANGAGVQPAAPGSQIAKARGVCHGFAECLSS